MAFYLLYIVRKDRGDIQVLTHTVYLPMGLIEVHSRDKNRVVNK